MDPVIVARNILDPVIVTGNIFGTLRYWTQCGQKIRTGQCILYYLRKLKYADHVSSPILDNKDECLLVKSLGRRFVR